MRRSAVLASVLAAAVLPGCLVQVTRVSDPSAAFHDARAEARRFSSQPGPAQELNVLVWEPEKGELVRVTLPMWLVRQAEGHWDWEDRLGDDEGGRRLRRRVGKHVRLEDIEKAGLGILVEVKGGDGEQVLVWLR